VTTTAELEKRLENLEIEVSRLKAGLPPAFASTPESGNNSWVRDIVGMFQNDPHYAEADRLGREWRQAQIPDYDAGVKSPQ